MKNSKIKFEIKILLRMEEIEFETELTFNSVTKIYFAYYYLG